MKSYYRVMLGQKERSRRGVLRWQFYRRTDFGINQDLSKKLPNEWRAFNKEFIPIYLAAHPGQNKNRGRGLACGALWTVSKGEFRKGGSGIVPRRHWQVSGRRSER